MAYISAVQMRSHRIAFVENDGDSEGEEQKLVHAIKDPMVLDCSMLRKHWWLFVYWYSPGTLSVTARILTCCKGVLLGSTFKLSFV